MDRGGGCADNCGEVGSTARWRPWILRRCERQKEGTLSCFVCRYRHTHPTKVQTHKGKQHFGSKRISMGHITYIGFLFAEGCGTNTRGEEENFGGCAGEWLKFENLIYLIQQR